MEDFDVSVLQMNRVTSDPQPSEPPKTDQATGLAPSPERNTSPFTLPSTSQEALQDTDTRAGTSGSPSRAAASTIPAQGEVLARVKPRLQVRFHTPAQEIPTVEIPIPKFDKSKFSLIPGTKKRPSSDAFGGAEEILSKRQRKPRTIEEPRPLVSYPATRKYPYSRPASFSIVCNSDVSYRETASKEQPQVVDRFIAPDKHLAEYGRPFGKLAPFRLGGPPRQRCPPPGGSVRSISQQSQHTRFCASSP